jgi:hypothetical protein
MTLVVALGGSIGSNQPRVIREFEDHSEAKDYAKRMRSYLSVGEKKYYGMTYKVVKVK